MPGSPSGSEKFHRFARRARVLSSLAMMRIGSLAVIAGISAALAGGCEPRDRRAAPRSEAAGNAAVAPTGVATADAMATIVAKPGALELSPGDGWPADCMSIAQYTKMIARYLKHPQVVAVHDFPAGLSARACVNVNMFVQGKNVTSVVDGDDARGYTLIYDENANGDLRDDPRHELARTPDGFELVVHMTNIEPKTHETFPIQLRLRRKAGKLFWQALLIRRGELAIDGHKVAFVLASSGDFAFPTAIVAFDLDGDGKAGPAELDPGEAHDVPEVRQVFERTVTIGARSYDFTVDLRGDHLTLTPRPGALAERPSLHVGTPAPDFTATDLDGKRVQLSALRGRTVLLDFWATGCGPCVRSLPRLSELYRRWRSSAFELVAIATDSRREDVMKLFETEPRAGIEVLDPDSPSTLGALSALYRVYEYPSYFVVGPDGNLVRSRCTFDEAVAYLESRTPHLPR